MKIIGLCGFANSGKSTIAQHLIAKHNFIRLSFAGAVKDVAAAMYGWDRLWLDGQTETHRQWRETPDEFWSAKFGKDFTPRMALQQIGQGNRDIIDPNIWVYIIEREICHIRFNMTNARIVIDDVRYVNERQMLQTCGSNLFVVHRSDDRGLIFSNEEYARLWNDAMEDCVLSNDPTPLHRSEWDWLRDPSLSKDPILLNNGNKEQFLKTVDIELGL